MLGTYENSGKFYTEKKEEFKSAQEDATIVHFTNPKPWDGEYNTKQAEYVNFQQWLNNFNIYGIKDKLNISKNLLNSQKVTIVEKYHKEWKEVAAKVVNSVYK